jgi:hypothetical protein
MTSADGSTMAPFHLESFELCSGRPDTYEHVSRGSAKKIWLNSCPTCHCTLFMTWENFPKGVGVFAGSFDDPNWFDRTPENTVYIFADEAPRGTILPAGFPIFRGHAHSYGQADPEPEIFSAHQLIAGKDQVPD